MKSTMAVSVGAVAGQERDLVLADSADGDRGTRLAKRGVQMDAVRV